MSSNAPNIKHDNVIMPPETIPKGFDTVKKPKHYNTHPSGVECIQITKHMSFCKGNAVKYIWRAGSKGDELEDLQKARQYLDYEIARIQEERAKTA